jgi:hypothetical protein
MSGSEVGDRSDIRRTDDPLSVDRIDTEWLPRGATRPCEAVFKNGTVFNPNKVAEILVSEITSFMYQKTVVFEHEA